MYSIGIQKNLNQFIYCSQTIDDVYEKLEYYTKVRTQQRKKGLNAV